MSDWTTWTAAQRQAVFDYAKADLVESGLLPEKFARLISLDDNFMVVRSDGGGNAVSGTERAFSSYADAEEYQQNTTSSGMLMGRTYRREYATIFAGAFEPTQVFPQYGVTTRFDGPVSAVQNVILHEFGHLSGCDHPCAHIRSHELMGIPFRIQEAK
jgi:hypothetical protein